MARTPKDRPDSSLPCSNCSSSGFGRTDALKTLAQRVTSSLAAISTRREAPRMLISTSSRSWLDMPL
jgi:hypothetical protein